MPSWKVLEGDCVDLLRDMPDASVDSIVTDPPYGLSSQPDAAEVLRHWLAGDDYQHRGSGFMGRSWDSFVPGPTVWRECLRVLKPGGHLLAFFGSRTFDLGTLAIRLAGFEVRDSIMWLYGSGFPKSLDVSKAIDKAAGVEREVVGLRAYGDGQTYNGGAASGRTGGGIMGDAVERGPSIQTAPSTPEAQQWEGWGTALKPAHEPIVVARKPLNGTVAANVLKHGTGALNIDACRIEGDVPSVPQPTYGVRDDGVTNFGSGEGRNGDMSTAPGGRWPANVVLDPEAAQQLDDQSGDLATNEPRLNRRGATTGTSIGGHDTYSTAALHEAITGFGDHGGASRFYYTAKASSAERNAGLDAFEEGIGGGMHATASQSMLTGSGNERNPMRRNVHPTVKPIDLMRWLTRLTTPPGGTILDPYTGSGTTGCAATLEQYAFIGCEQSPEYAAIARARIQWWANQPAGIDTDTALAGNAERQKVEATGQTSLI